MSSLYNSAAKNTKSIASNCQVSGSQVTGHGCALLLTAQPFANINITVSDGRTSPTF
jgi:hypothetical protein